MGLSSLDAALSGLRIAQQQISVISNNVANASTPGFTRKILPQSAQSIQGTTVGVLGETIIRNVNLNLQRDLWTQVSAVGLNSIKKNYLGRIDQFHGPAEAEISISAELGRLQDAFSALSDSPEEQFLQAAAVDQAVDTANKINDLSNLITTLRNDAQLEIENTINNINALLVQVANLNNQIVSATNVGRTTALLEDNRDQIVKELSEYIEISYFTKGDGALVVQTNQGTELASNFAAVLDFTPNPLSATLNYPDDIDGITVTYPDSSNGAVDITTLSPGGKLGGLLELRDVTFPKQMAQLDELAHKLAIRTEAQGLRLFTDQAGLIPADTAPDPTADPPTTVSYIGFSAVIRVNQDILNDHSLLQQGTATTDVAVQSGSNEVVRRIVEFAFGDIAYQQATGTIDMRANTTGGVDLQNWLGLSSSNTITGGRGLDAFTDVASLVSSANGDLDAPADEFQIVFSETRSGLGTATITVSLTNAAAQPGANALEQIVAEIDAQITAAGLPAGLTADAAVGPNGEIVITSSGTVDIDSSFGATGMSQTGLTYLGLNDGTYTTEDPYFDVQVGQNDPVRIYIEPGDTEADLIDKLILNASGDSFNAAGDTTGIAGLAFDETTFNATGELILRPGDDFDNPGFGGDLKIISGPFEIDPAAAGSPDLAALGAGNGVNIVSALFGSFSAGPPSQDVNPISNVTHGSTVSASDSSTVSFRGEFLGPNAAVNTEIVASGDLLEFAQRMVNEHAQELITAQNTLADEDSLRELLQNQFTNDSGVNIDQELSNLVVMQTAYSAAARVINAVDELFDELLRVI